MNEIIFSSQREEGVKIEVRIPVDSSLDEVLASLEDFLLASGYRFSGRIDIVNEELTNV